MRKYEEEVLAGAAFLDEKVPGWEQRIDLNQLSLRMPCRCVLGQLFHDEESPPSSYENAVEVLGIEDYDDEGNGIEESLGFNIPDDAPNHDFGPLTKEWKRQIKERLVFTEVS